MGQPTSSYQELIDGQLITINVYPSTVQKKRNTGFFVTQKARADKLRNKNGTMKLASAYDRAVNFGSTESEAE